MGLQHRKPCKELVYTCGIINYYIKQTFLLNRSKALKMGLCVAEVLWVGGLGFKMFIPRWLTPMAGTGSSTSLDGIRRVCGKDETAPMGDFQLHAQRFTEHGKWGKAKNTLKRKKKHLNQVPRLSSCIQHRNRAFRLLSKPRQRINRCCGTGTSKYSTSKHGINPTA